MYLGSSGAAVEACKLELKLVTLWPKLVKHSLHRNSVFLKPKGPHYQGPARTFVHPAFRNPLNQFEMDSEMVCSFVFDFFLQMVVVLLVHADTGTARGMLHMGNTAAASRFLWSHPVAHGQWH